MSEMQRADAPPTQRAVPGAAELDELNRQEQLLRRRRGPDPGDTGMDLTTAIRVMARRWFVSVPLLILTAYVVATYHGNVQPTYSATATFTLVGPAKVPQTTKKGVVYQPVNPYLRLGALTPLVDIITIQVNGPAYRADFQRPDRTTNFTIAQRGKLPFVNVTSEAGRPAIADNTVRHVIDIFRRNLQTQQTRFRTPTNQRITIQVLAAPSVAVAANNASKRIKAVALGLGLLVTFVVSLLADMILQRSGSRRTGRLRGVIRSGARRLQARYATPAAAGPEAPGPPVDDPVVAEDEAVPGNGSRVSAAR